MSIWMWHGALAVGMALALGPATPAQEPAPLQVTATLKAAAVPLCEIFEITFRHDRVYANPFFDVQIEMVFTAPSGKAARIGGFHYGTDKPVKVERELAKDAKGREVAKVSYILPEQNLWKARFAPAELGKWRYAWNFKNAAGQQATGQGTFQCVKEGAGHGFVRQDPNNPFQWKFDDGAPFFPIGMQEGVGDSRGNGSLLAARWLMDGPFKENRPPNAPPLPEGPQFKTGHAEPVSAEVYFKAFAGAGFNFWRFANATGGNMKLTEDLDHYLVHQHRMLDEFFDHLRRHKIRISFSIFGDQYKRTLFGAKPENPEDIAKVKRFIAYCVNRWGAYADFWELLNEAYPDDAWYAIMAPHLRSVDPYRHPITTSYEKPELAGIEVNAPHWYSPDENELESDMMTVEHCIEWRRFGKPIIVGEQGNDRGRQRFRDFPRPGEGGNWDPRSGVRMRIRLWTAFIHEVSFVFWHTGYAKDGYFANIWLGPEERQYVKAFSRAVELLGGDIVKKSNLTDLADRQVSVSDYRHVRGYQIFAKERMAAYLHHFDSHATPVKGCQLIVNAPKAGKAFWYSPEDGTVLKVIEVQQGRQTAEVPEFTVDIALLVNPVATPER